MPWLCALCIASAPLALAQPATANWGLAQLMQELAQVHSASASFTERKTVQVLSTPLVASGSLSYVAPDYIRKATLLPVPENFVLDHDQITISGGPDQQTHVFSLNADPRIGGLVEGIRATLAGDLPALDHYYIVRLSGDAANWQLLLQPKNPGAARMIKWIIIRGKQNHLDGLDTASGNGDHSEMSIAEDVSDAQ
ncbi:LolA-related protein [Acidocella aquatica]|uniref:LolA-related protein n=1 Tax=Acidocella aquatica TaxID=1922313 RepID=UPI0024E076FB|nr:LolA-related protein [Acidocella aquatica]